MRKSVSYLTSLRHELCNECEKLHELTEFLEHETFDLSNMSIDEIRTNVNYTDNVESRIEHYQIDIKKQLQVVHEAIVNLRKFF